MALNAVTISVAWALDQYRQVLQAVNARKGAGFTRLPQDPPDVERYFRAIGVGRNIDIYA